LFSPEPASARVTGIFATPQESRMFARVQMPAGIQDQGRPATGLTPPHLETYEVTMHA
jgi:hypothetical protein